LEKGQSEIMDISSEGRLLEYFIGLVPLVGWLVPQISGKWTTESRH
jgi:hypothetical protein